MSHERRPVRKFPDDWFRADDYTPPGGSQPREPGFNRHTHGSELLAGIRQAYLSKPKDAMIPDPHIYFAARTWRDRPSLRRNIETLHAKVYRVLPDGTIVGGWPSRHEYEYSKEHVSRYESKHVQIADLDYIESVKGLDPRDKLGRSLLEILELEDLERVGKLSVSFYPDYAKPQIEQILAAIERHLSGAGFAVDRLITGPRRHTALWSGPLYLTEEIAKRVEAAAIIEQVGELRPAATTKLTNSGGVIKIAVRPGLPEVGVLDTGVSASNPLLKGVLLSGAPTLDHVDWYGDAGHGTFVAGVLAYGDDPGYFARTSSFEPRAVIHPRKVAVPDAPNGVNLEVYNELATMIEELRPQTRVFTVALCETRPIDSDNIGQIALNLDQLGSRYGVLFVLPMGNLPNFTPGGSPSADQPDYDNAASWCEDANARMGRPGEAFNALTVASVAEHQVGDEWAPVGWINAYSRRGPGPKATPKPDLAAAGGNCVVRGDPDHANSIVCEPDDHPRSAISGLKAPTGFIKSFGTSFAVPKVAFTLSVLVQLFEKLGQPAAAPLLAKAYLIHVCRMPDSIGPFPDHWTADEKRERRHLLYGYGVPDQQALTGVPPSEVCFYAATTIERRKRHIYSLRFPANVLNILPDVLLRVTLTYFAPVDAETLDAELYSLVDINVVVRWGGKTLQKLPRGGPLADCEYYPLKSFEVRFAKPQDREPSHKGQPTVEVIMKDRVRDVDEVKQSYAILISLVSTSGELLVSELLRESDEQE